MSAGALFAVAAGFQVLSALGQGVQAKASAKAQASQYRLQIAQMEQQKKILAEQYKTKRAQLTGTLITRAGKNGVRVSGSVADSLSQSLFELGMEESYQKYNISMNQVNAEYNARVSKANGRYAMIGGLLNAGSSALSSYATYDYYWGSGKQG